MFRPNDPTQHFDPREARKEILHQMLIGAFATIGAIAVVALFLMSIYLISLILPPDSKDAADPTPDSFSQLVEHDDTRIV